MQIISFVFKLIITFALFSVIGVLGLYFYFKAELPSAEELSDTQLQTPMQIFSQEGLLISQYGEKKRIPLTLEQMPPHMINAILDTEDSRFYSHYGVDFIGFARIIFKAITTNQRRQGASTITMQLARNMHLTHERTITRKIKEIFIAFHIERLFSKDQILELYLNKIALGHRAFGVGAAAQVYYGTDINQLTLAQIATIAGLPKAPSTLNPISQPERSKQRRAIVLGRMLAMGNITQAEYDEAVSAPVTAKRHGVNIQAPAPYIADMVNQWMLEKSGLDQIYTKGYQVYTSIPWTLQQAAQQAVINNLHQYDERHGYRIEQVTYLWQNSPEQNDLATATDPQAICSAPQLQIEQPQPNHCISDHLATINEYPPLMPAVVIAIDEQSATVQLKNDAIVTLDWQNLKWARPFISDSKQGPSPKVTSDIFRSGAQIYVRQIDNGLYRLAQLPEPSGALVAISPQNGAIRSLVGGYSYNLSQYNRATQAKRQVGSTIKPFIYSAALDQGLTLASLITDAPIHQWNKQLGVAWRPKNSPPVYDGPIRIRVALAKSKNVVSLRLLKKVGLDNVIEHLNRFGIDGEQLPKNESLALGSASLTPLQIATATSVFANGGYLIEPYFIERILDQNDQLVYQADPVKICNSCAPNNSFQTESPTTPAPRAISEQNAFLISQAMTSTIWGGGSWRHATGWNGTGWRATRQLKRRDISGKTGTTNDAKDTWFSGFTPQLMVTTWVGFDDPSRTLGRSRTGSESGGVTAQPAWIDYMTVSLKNTKEQTITIPTDIISVRIDQNTGLLAIDNDHTTRFEYFISGTEPQQYATPDQTPDILDDEQGTVNDKELLF